MILECQLEKKLMDYLAAAMESAGVADVQVLGSWQPAQVGEIKAVGENCSGYLTVKLSPRALETFLIADATFSVSVSLNMRAELDGRGEKYLAATEALVNALYLLHSSMTTVSDTFNVENSFFATGVRLDGGDSGLDRANSAWTWTQTLTLQGQID